MIIAPPARIARIILAARYVTGKQPRVQTATATRCAISDEQTDFASTQTEGVPGQQTVSIPSAKEDGLQCNTFGTMAFHTGF
mmetsp:Transcript_41814/g.95945  ORF Transcript_41814/g.95945 Transcript_41814/m.95945 type:complete len:82 (+) Transcript_41814:244-489(+)